MLHNQQGAIAGRRLSRREVLRLAGLVGGACFAAAAVGACSPQQLAQQAGAKQRLSIVTGTTGGVYYPYGGGIAKIISENIKGTEATAEATAGSVDNMKLIKDNKADLAITLADTLSDALKGEGPFKETGKVNAFALAVLYTNYTHVVTFADKPINKIADLKGKNVSTGAAGSGTEIIAFRMLEAAGLNPQTDITKQALSPAQSGDAMKDGKLDAFFWSGGVPTGAVLDLSTARKIKILPNDDVLPAMQQKYGKDLYFLINVPKGAYGIDADVPVIGVANVFVSSDRLSDQLAYEITKLLFEKQQELIQIHSEAKNLTLQTAIVGSPAPFHKGAIKFYQEKGVWKG